MKPAANKSRLFSGPLIQQERSPLARATGGDFDNHSRESICTKIDLDRAPNRKEEERRER